MGYISLRTPRDIGLVLREARKRAKMNQADLAERLGVSRKWVVEAERGNSGAALGTVLRALEVVGVRLGSVTSDDASARPPHPAYPPEIDIDAVVAATRKRPR
jgi:HTH-type transcriptional regulator / antitoxin HipB